MLSEDTLILQLANALKTQQAILHRVIDESVKGPTRLTHAESFAVAKTEELRQMALKSLKMHGVDTTKGTVA